MPLASAVCSDTELPPKGRGRCFSKTGLTTELDFGAGKTVDRRVLFLSGAALASGLLTWYPGSDARTDPVLLSSLRRKMRWNIPAILALGLLCTVGESDETSSNGCGCVPGICQRQRRPAD